jgi:CRP/FNR family transcriptional regulator, nitrogen oxide reductase regulator
MPIGCDTTRLTSLGMGVVGDLPPRRAGCNTVCPGRAAPRRVLSCRRWGLQEVRTLLKVCPIFAALPPHERDRLAAVAQSVSYRPREYVFMEGDPGRWLCIVSSGRVRVVRHSPAGRDVVLELLGAGGVFGGVAVFEQRPYPAAAQATESTAVVKIPAEALLPLGERYPSVIKEMAPLIGQRLRTAHDSVRSLAVDPVEVRLARTLLRLAERDGTRGDQGIALPFHLTRQGLADMAGTTVETTIRIMRRWSKDGLVLDTGGRLLLKEVNELRRLAADAG